VHDQQPAADWLIRGRLSRAFVAYAKLCAKSHRGPRALPDPRTSGTLVLYHFFLSLGRTAVAVLSFLHGRSKRSAMGDDHTIGMTPPVTHS
jgi:hypothetical protein